MYQLLLDSSNKYLTVALAKDNKLVDVIFYEAWQRQSEMMVVEIDNILKRNKVSRADLDAVVTGIGPGSYTGVRIAISIAKTIAYALKIKLYAVSSLSLLKIKDEPTITIFNARSGRCYFAVYQGEKVLEADKVLTNEEVNKYIDEHPSYLLSGDLDILGRESAEFDIASNLVKVLGDEKYLVDPFKVTPIYLKDLLKWAK